MDGGIVLLADIFLYLRLYVGIIFDFALLINFDFLIVRIELNCFVTKVVYAYHMDYECFLSAVELHLYNINSQRYIKNNIVHPCDI